ncbi:HipA family kinase [Effusibacillus pohliae]|uniref:HipA family kinase n=1 Tax=Effusibacillus pohliae TaxID=232270 RepID=UPI000368B761|nr:HipA family kinase [Effusibacillus pohliae]
MQPVAYKRCFPGKSGAHLIAFDDGREYVVKFLKPGFERTLANEWIAYCLARFLQLPVPPAKLVEIPPSFCRSVPALATVPPTQKQFASLYIDGCVDGTAADVQYVVNHRSLPGIILLDYWLCNRDRTRKNILLQEQGPGTYYLWMIDQAEIFGSYGWMLPHLETLPVGILKSAVHQLMARFIEEERQFYEQLDVIQTIPSLLLEEILAFVPNDWGLTSVDKRGIISTLLYRRQKSLPHLVHKFIKNVYRPLHTQLDGET